ncbi:hypothetical protein QYE76_045604 [Lolium multiflorum]|uniref:CCHC-type domain-containing protein n=1 Tax=Lolium multiflorum TaxID=4521 RepID=A0AAD8TLQ5_LOLMU|nr:hypothetical protein QYE76_045604 [Lolium multiflorum]
MAPPTRNNSRAQANQIHTEHAKMTDTINILAMERKALRHQHAKKDYLIARLRVKIASLERLIPVPHHAPRAKSNVTCYACGATGHYSNKCPRKATNNAPRTGSNAVPIAQTSKSTVTCYECGTVGHYSNECRKKLSKIAANPAAPAQQQRRFATRRNCAPNYPNNRNGRYYNMKATEAQETPQNIPRHAPSPAQDHAVDVVGASTANSGHLASTDWTPPTSPCSLQTLSIAGNAVSMSTCRAPPGHLATYKRSAPPPPILTPIDLPPLPDPPRTLSPQHCAPQPLNCIIAARAPSQKPPELEATPGPATCSRSTAVIDNLLLHQRRPSPTFQLAVDPLPPPCQRRPRVDDDDDPQPPDRHLILRPASFHTVSVSLPR